MAKVEDKNFFLILDAVAKYYGYGSDQWYIISKYGFETENAYKILQQVPNVVMQTNKDGSIRDWVYVSDAILDAEWYSGNSNINPTSTVVNYPAVTTIDATTKTVKAESGLGKYVKTGKKAIGVAADVATAVAAVSVGATLGKVVDKALYNINPDFWDEHNMQSLNPDTWETFTSENKLGNTVLNSLLGLNEDGSSTQYMDENALAYMALYMQKMGVFDESKGTATPPQALKLKEVKEPYNFYPYDYIFYDGTENIYNDAFIYDNVKDTVSKSVFYYNHARGAVPETVYATKENSLTMLGDKKFTYNNKTVTWTASFSLDDIGKKIDNATPLNDYSKPITDWSTVAERVAWSIIYGDIIKGIEGITTQKDATTPDLKDATTVDDVLKALKKQYPNLWDDAITKDVLQPDGTTKTYTYVPVASAAVDENNNPVTSDDSTQKSPSISPSALDETLLKTLAETIGKPVTPVKKNDDSQTGKGETPTTVIPTGTASALYKIYNPTQSQLDSFGSWLWSSDFVDQLLKLFNDPMQAIIGLHKVYCPVPVGGTINIKVGYLDSKVPSNYISNQYVTIDCGSVAIRESFENVFDYSPFTKIHIYLPFIGIEELNVGDVMRSTISVIYHCDVLTGACLAEINVSRDGGGGTLYTFTGNCAVQYPISSGSYMGIVSSLASIAGGVVGTVASGGAIAPVTMGAISSALNAHTSVQHSGSFSGNAGAMGIKTPYLIITRPQTVLADSFPEINGYPVNHSITIGACSGYIEVENCHVYDIPATDNELSEIKTLLKNGVII